MTHIRASATVRRTRRLTATQRRRFQRAVSSGDGLLEDKVNVFLAELAEPYKDTPSEATTDVDAGRQWQYDDIAEHLYGLNTRNPA